jgi:hypothetical protein
VRHAVKCLQFEKRYSETVEGNVERINVKKSEGNLKNCYSINGRR